jgi:DNA-binding response OmpR family regulator
MQQVDKGDHVLLLVLLYHPILDGLLSITHINAIHKIPSILISTYDDNLLIRHSRLIGIDDYVSIPVADDALTYLIKALLIQ